MAAAHAHNDLHRLIDQLTPEQANAVCAVVSQLVKGAPEERDQPSSKSHRKLSFEGLMNAEPDLAERSGT